MKVRVKDRHADAKFGFYGTRVRPAGTEFPLKKEEDFDPSWMEWVEKPKPVKAKKSPKKEQPKDDDEIDLGL